MLNKIISGGQTGADQGALVAARELCVASGGCAPKGWLTENRPEPALLRGSGLVECEEDGYPARTRRNVIDSDGTLLVGQYQSGGSGLTYELANQFQKPLFLVGFPKYESVRVQEFRDWLEKFEIQTLNVAGNRESESPGIAEYTRRFLIVALRLGIEFRSGM